MKNRGSLVVISGFAGVGKGSILNEMMKRHEGYAYSVSATTRSPRPGETDGVNYFFISREKFEEMIEKGELLEYASYVENYYGTPRFYVERMMAEGRDVLLEIDIQGAMNIRKSTESTKLTIALEGRLDTTTAPQLEGELATALDGITDLIFDLADLDYISSAGLRVLLSAQKKMNKQGSMIVRHSKPEIMEIFDVTGFTDILTLED